MAKNSISFDEVKDLFLTFAKDHPGWTAIGAGIGCGIAYAVPKLGPTIETCWKYSVDKVVERLPKPSIPATFAEDAFVDVSDADPSNESNAA